MGLPSAVRVPRDRNVFATGGGRWGDLGYPADAPPPADALSTDGPIRPPLEGFPYTITPVGAHATWRPSEATSSKTASSSRKVA